jgi:sulfite reductase beta subunit-like hemoprotein
VTTRDTATIEIPRLPGERAERHEARVLYLTMGADRSQEAVSEKLGKSRQLIGRWSAEDGWAEQARNYDSVSAQVAVARHRAEYDKALEEHRRKVLEKTASLTKILDGLEAQVARALTGQVIEGADGKTYYIPKMPIEVSAVAALMRGRLTVADMEAHALDIPGLRAALLEGGDDA